jgi:Protein of unknown function (DUF2750)
MAAEPDDEEYERVVALSHLKRMLYLHKEVVRNGELWTLARGEDTLLLGSAESPAAVPVWPAERFARAYAEESETPLRISLDEWLAEWSPRVREADHQVAVFPLPGGEAGYATPEEFEEDLRAARAGPLPLP